VDETPSRLGNAKDLEQQEFVLVCVMLFKLIRDFLWRYIPLRQSKASKLQLYHSLGRYALD
jgi:hypothetical protein